MSKQSKIRRDPELQAYIDTFIGKVTYDETHQRCEKKFGASRTPSRSALARYWLATWSHKGQARPPRSIIERDGELRSFIEAEKEGRIFEQMHEACCERFGVSRAPSAAAIARYWMRVHGRVRRKRGYRRGR